MFGYLRYFAVVSMVIVVAAAYMVGVYFRSVASDDLGAIVQKNNMTLTQGYVNSIWKQHHSVLERLYRIHVNKWSKYREFHEFKQQTLQYFQEMPVSEVTIYTPDGELMVSTDPSKQYASMLPLKQRPLFSRAKDGTLVGDVLEDVLYFLPNGDSAKGTFVRTFAPIYSDYYVPVLTDNTSMQIEGVMVIHYNITEQWRKLRLFQYISTAGIIVIFVVLFVLLFFSSRRAEGIIAKQHEVNLELTAAAASAEAENRDKSQFLANISHELRTPLNAIIGFSEIIKHDTAANLSDTYREYITDIHGSGVHLLSLINDILDFSKAEAGKLEVNVAELDPVKLVKNSMRLVIPRAEQAQVTLVEELPKEHFALQTDAKKLKQILLNLLSNSVKFTPAGGRVTMSLWENPSNQTVVFKVSDTGIGIAPKDISKVMMPFGQVDSKLSRQYEGTGLGLPLSKKFVEVLGGTFKIESEVGKGTSILITLPQAYSR